MDDAGIGPVVKIQRVTVQSVQEHRLFQGKLFPCADRMKHSFLGPGEVIVTLQLLLLEAGARAGDSQIVEKAVSGSRHDLIRNRRLPHSVDLLQKSL